MKPTSPAPGYAFISLPERVDRQPRPPHAAHDRRHEATYSGTLRLTWLAEQPIHIGTGFKRLVGDRNARAILREHARLGDVPCIPGSSLKGVLRARFEAVTHSCFDPPKHDVRVKIRSSTFNERGITHAILNADAVRGFERTCRSPGPLCPACALFGALNLRSRLVVTDARPAAPTLDSYTIPEQFVPNLHHVGRLRVRESDNVLEIQRLHGRKFAVGRDERPPPSNYAHAAAQRQAQPQRLEVLPVGTHLHSELRYTNLTTAELGGLLAALGLAPRSRLKIGGGKCHGLGRLFLAEHTHRPRGKHDDEPLDLDGCAHAFARSPACQAANLARLVALHGEDC
ncbi:RAMP superfamily CRISPR-associated protein [Nannocystis sp. RBIL2]|uniref:RAMP superfamily CRISPR-associated protein n=1 Tax=Nannocystis sp. RBIL2 TaxID=2996788 RepID=UPI00226FF9FB|nr:RAMP superfamily CRISPR-associated protein [Nannocystis sp. RBIL2]MCY1071207.1 RAMP superfamily CRISPR-associated protein [Nannocystis sp. RBIL2]